MSAPPTHAPPTDAPPTFGTSGLRGLVTGLTPDLVGRHVTAFVTTCNAGDTILIAEDLRASSPQIAAVAAQAVTAAGRTALRLGALPTPALALAARTQSAGAIMITGSHIPADRNGLKFYTAGGHEITKRDEVEIVAAAQGPAADPVGTSVMTHPANVESSHNRAATEAYVARYRSAFGPDALRGQRLAVYAHSSVARDLMTDLLRRLGADVTELGRSATFVPVDTEAVSQATRARLADWAGNGERFDAILSTDGDGDRPLLTDADGAIVPGDVLGAVTARFLGATHVVTPVTSSTLVDRMGFDAVMRTRVGSPYVIAGMADLAGARVVGFEANGGFLLGFDAAGLTALPTRDAMLPLLAPLLAARSRRQSLAALVADLPPRVTASDRIPDVDRARAARWIGTLTRDPAARAAFWDGAVVLVDTTDGLRMTHPGGGIVHLRLSGNAPELRVYAEADTVDAARVLLIRGVARAGAMVQG